MNSNRRPIDANNRIGIKRLGKKSIIRKRKRGERVRWRGMIARGRLRGRDLVVGREVVMSVGMGEMVKGLDRDGGSLVRFH
jgi:hypothetical protein